MAKDWFVAQDGKTYGPYPSARLKELARTGRISSDATVSNSTDGPWYPISRVKGLEINAPAPVPPPPAPQSAQATPNPNHAQPKSAIEKPVWKGHPSQITNIKTFILCTLSCWLIIPIFVAVWRWLVVRFMTYELTTQRLKMSHGVISRHTDELELYRVKDTSFSQDVFQRIFGLASVLLTTSDPSTPSVVIRSINASRAKQLREEIRTITEELRDRKRVREVDYT